MNTLGGLTWVFLSCFLCCNFGERVTHQFNLFDEKLRCCDWYLFPIKIQRLILITMSADQHPCIIHGYANTVCTRDAFKRVNAMNLFIVLIMISNDVSIRQTVNGGFSYFMMLQRIYGWKFVACDPATWEWAFVSGVSKVLNFHCLDFRKLQRNFFVVNA